MDSPEEPHLMAGAVEPVVAQVKEDSSHQPGHCTVPGQASQPVLLVDVVIGLKIWTSSIKERLWFYLNHEEPSKHSCCSHKKATGNTGNTVCNVLFLASDVVVDDTLQQNQHCHIGDDLCNVIYEWKESQNVNLTWLT